MTRFLIAAFVCLFAGSAYAECAGTDLRPTLSDAERTELSAATKGAPYQNGNHWRAERNGTALHIIGTLHLSDPRMDAPFARLKPLIENAALLLLEMTKTEEAKLQAELTQSPDLVTLKGTTLPEIMEEEAWQALADAASERGLPPFVAAKMQPWYLSMLLALPSCMTLSEQSNGLDSRLQTVALANDIPLRALEPFDTIFELFSGMDMADQIEMLNTSLTAPDTSEDQFATLLAAYFEEAHYQSWVASRILARRDAPLSADQMDAAFDQMEQALLVGRNKAWIPVILDALANTDGLVVAAFGAGHLGGDDGILALLAAEGFTLRRQPF